ncbi:MAG: SGNH hydrolase domain-containing protein [Kineosporiaceae bacterium]
MGRGLSTAARTSRRTGGGHGHRGHRLDDVTARQPGLPAARGFGRAVPSAERTPARDLHRCRRGRRLSTRRERGRGALSLSEGLQGPARAAGLTRVQAAWPGCGAGRVPPALLPSEPRNGTAPDFERLCSEQAPALLTAALSAPGTTDLLISDATVATSPLGLDGRGVQPGTAAHDGLIRSTLLRIVDAAAERGVRVVLLEQPPPSGALGPLLAPGRPAGERAPSPQLAADLARYDAVLREVAAARPAAATVVSLTDVVCPDRRCPAVIDGLLVRKGLSLAYSAAFARRVAPLLLRRIDAAPGEPAPRYQPALTPPRPAG